jgi:alkylation response protein AidB-like acyl-CoA dehydrogenase
VTTLMASGVDSDAASRLFALVEQLRPIIKAHQAEADQLRRIPDAVVAAIAERNLIRMMLPQHLGGAGVDPVTGLRVVEEVAAMDASVAWNFSLGAFGLRWLGVMPEAWGREFLATPASQTAGSLNAAGRAVATPGGYLVSGHFHFASGIHQATWVVGGCRVFDGDVQRTTPAGTPVVGDAVMPRSAVTTSDDWHVGGMRGTGSTGFNADAVFVPDPHLVMRGTKPWRPDPFFRFVVVGAPFASITLGIARCAIDGFLELVESKTLAHAWRTAVKENPANQYDLAKAQALVESSRSYLLEAIQQLWDAVQDGSETPLEVRARVRRAQVHAAESAVTAVDMMYKAAGATALFESSPFERCLRDVHAAAAQINLQRVLMEDAGRVAFGLTPRQPLF